MRILLSAYACEPGKGSEPGVGWGWLRSLARNHQVHLVTRENNQEPITRALALEPDIERNATIEGHEVGRFALWLKRRGILPVSIYYILWQGTLAWRMRRKLESFDVVHHVTFNGFRTPGAWWYGNVPVVLGPLGGSAVAPEQFLHTFHQRKFAELLRTLSIRFWHLNPWTRLSLASATRVLVVTKELQREMEKVGVGATLQLECAISRELEEAEVSSGGNERKGFVWAGTLEPWKGWTIALEAYSKAFADRAQGPVLRVFGDGRDREMAEQRVSGLGISHLVSFEGKCSQKELWEAMRRSKGLLFSSIRETSGNVVLEAMANRCPVICINHQGAAIMTSEETACRVELADWDQVVEGMADGLKLLESDRALVVEMGDAGRRRILDEFTWSSKINMIEHLYSDIVSK